MCSLVDHAFYFFSPKDPGHAPGLCFAKETCSSSKLIIKLCRPPQYEVQSSRCDSLPALAPRLKQPTLSRSLVLALRRERDVRETADVSQLSASWLKAEIATSAADVSQLSALWLKAERAQSTADVFQLSTSWLKAEPMSS